MGAPMGFEGVLPPRKPMVKTRRVSLFQREIRVHLSSAADLLLELGSVLSEGQVEEDYYFGSTMITIDLSMAADRVSDACDIATARRIAELLTTDKRAQAQAKRTGADEARRIAQSELIDPQIDVGVQRNGVKIQIDLDVEASVARRRTSKEQP